jgi:hypothetical protein
MMSSLGWVLLAQDVPGLDQLQNSPNLKLYIGAGAVVVVLVVIALMRRGKRPVDPEHGLSENLAGFPPAPGQPGRRRLVVHGQPMRLRLIVVAPTGKKPLSTEDAEALVGSMIRGMDEILKADRPRVRVWPVQYSNIGFAQSFFRRVLRPEARGRMSQWVRVAGPAKSGATPILLGLALMADEPTDVDELSLDGNEWLDVLQVVAN